MHQRILRAIRYHDPAGARLAMEQHLQLSCAPTFKASDLGVRPIPSVPRREAPMSRAV
jgi:hypothetical protein